MTFFIGTVAFICEYFDSGLGMGYGTALAPILILTGYNPLQIVPAILVSQFFTDVAACIFHQNIRNVNLKFGSADFKVASLLGVISSVGVIIASTIALKISRWLLTLYIGLLVLCMGIAILVTVKRSIVFSWRKIIALSFFASFNKGISGGGYGPLVMGGQLLSGVCPKSAVGITAFAEAITCLVGFAVYFAMGKKIDWSLTLLLTLCATPAVPFAALTIKK